MKINSKIILASIVIFVVVASLFTWYGLNILKSNNYAESTIELKNGKIIIQEMPPMDCQSGCIEQTSVIIKDSNGTRLEPSPILQESYYIVRRDCPNKLNMTIEQVNNSIKNGTFCGLKNRT